MINVRSQIKFVFCSFFLLSFELTHAQFLGLHSEIHAISEYGTTYRLYAEFGSPLDQIVSVFHYGFDECIGNYDECNDPLYPLQGVMPMDLAATTNFYQHPVGVDFGSENNPELFSFFPGLEYDSWLTIGSTTIDDYSILSLEMSNELDEFNSGNGIVTENGDEGLWFVLPDANPLAMAGDDGLVLLAQLTVANESDGTQGHFTILCNIAFQPSGYGGQEYELAAYLDTQGLSTVLTGCMDETACNYEPTVVIENGSCEYLDACNICGGAGIPDGACDCSGNMPDLGYDCQGNCLSDENNNGICDFNELVELENSVVSGDFCGSGTTWDYELEQCMPFTLCQEDLDGDGVIGISDLMELLSSFGMMCEEPETGEFTCGDPMNYHGYDYATVQIGEQCWFAENLRNEHYANGDAIPGDLSNTAWINTTEGAQAIYSNDASNLADYGRLYNGYAVDDARGLCPSGWHVPTDGEFMTLEMELGMSESEANDTGWRGTDQGTQMKSSPEDSPSWNGTNTFGFSALAAGFRSYDANFGVQGFHGHFWSSSSFGADAWERTLYDGWPIVVRLPSPLRSGFSVRCVRD